MLKKILGSKVEQSVFPKQGIENNPLVSTNEIIKRILKDEGFITKVSDAVTNDILDILVKKYNFEPNDKYKKEIEDKKMYINQLDEYLLERKQINVAVENELQQFLNETTNNISKALNEFSAVIKSRITNAQKQYGIDKIKETLLDNGN